MQKVTLLLIFSLVFGFGKAQNSISPNAKWTMHFEDFGGGSGSDQWEVILNTDTIINSISYQKLNDGTIFKGDSNQSIWIYSLIEEKEIILYNFSLEVGDSITYDFKNDTLISGGDTFIWDNKFSLHVTDRDSVNWGEIWRNRITLDSTLIWVEGIGDIKLGFSAPHHYRDVQIPEYSTRLRCFHKGDTLVYLNDYFDDCIYDDTGIEEINKIEVSFSPNPIESVSVLQIENSNYHNLKINIYNSAGILITSDKISNNQYIINSKKYTSGIHFYRIESDKGEFLKSGKIVVK